ncbi:hypothetical protein [Brevundimonas sp.]|uniref:hypothetical protein n=1 Tax=Brevundimonas sp. TaxID=1871086 RepID=UPI002C2F7CB6|nr:hypothetical protein [Brevundimonas sp.]HWQ85465.1 hypothetical protein [Brevundimonas sp.]
MISRLWIAGAIAAVAGVSACGNGGSAVETRDRAADAGEAVLTAASGAPAPARRLARSLRPNRSNRF